MRVFLRTSWLRLLPCDSRDHLPDPFVACLLSITFNVLDLELLGMLGLLGLNFCTVLDDAEGFSLLRRSFWAFISVGSFLKLLKADQGFLAALQGAAGEGPDLDDGVVVTLVVEETVRITCPGDCSQETPKVC